MSAPGQGAGAAGRARWRRRFVMGAWAVVDQGLFAGAHFVLHVLLAVWLSPQEYGAFVVSFSGLLLVGAMHSALLTEPMLVFGPGRHRAQVPAYVGRLVQGHLGLSVVATCAGLAGLAAASLLGLPPDLVHVLLAAVLAAPFVLYLWLVRRACYVVSGPRTAATAGAGYLAALVVGGFAMHRAGVLDAQTTWALLAVVSLSCGLWLHRRQRLVMGGSVDGSAVAREHWHYARWALPTGLMGWIPANAFVIVLPLWAGLAATAQLRAGVNLVYPLLHVNGALGMLLLPALVRARDAGRFGPALRSATGALLAVNAGYTLLAVLSGQRLWAVLYGDKYEFDVALLWLIALLPVVTLPTLLLGAGLRAVERPDLAFAGSAAGAVTALVAGIPIVAVLGIHGALLAPMLVSVVTATVMAALLRRSLSTAEPAPAREAASADSSVTGRRA